MFDLSEGRARLPKPELMTVKPKHIRYDKGITGGRGQISLQPVFLAAKGALWGCNSTISDDRPFILS